MSIKNINKLIKTQELPSQIAGTTLSLLYHIEHRRKRTTLIKISNLCVLGDFDLKFLICMFWRILIGISIVYVLEDFDLLKSMRDHTGKRMIYIKCW